MSATIAIACPDCHKELKVPAELAGKKIKCKGCGATFPIQAKAAPTPPPAKPKSILDDDGPAQFGLQAADKGVARCPHCATALESDDAVICIHCGYNLRTRQRIESRKVVETTSSDQMAWLLPAFACLVLILVLIGFNLWYLLKLEEALEGSGLEWLAYKGFKVWVVIISLFAIFFAGKFAVRRLILQPRPPEQGQQAE